MTFDPTAEKLLPDLTPAEELVILARTLWREGYDDHLAGHIRNSHCHAEEMLLRMIQKNCVLNCRSSGRAECQDK